MPSRRLFILSDSPALPTGQARVLRELAWRFVRDGADVHVGAWFHPPTSGGFPYPISPVDKQHPELLSAVLNDVKPDAVLAIGDLQHFTWLATDARRSSSHPFVLTGYLNIDGEPLAPGLERTLDGFDHVVTTSDFGRMVIDRPGVLAVHHGVDLGTFRPMPRPPQISGRSTDNLFVVFVNGQNTYRKNLAAAIQGFAQFAENRPDVFCYLNTQPVTKIGPNLADVVVQANVQSKVAFSGSADRTGPLSTVSEAELVQMYASATVLLVSSRAEGFCLPLLEAMAMGVVPIAPNWFSAPELLREHRGYLIPIAARVRDEYRDGVIVEASAVASRLELAYWAWRDGSISEARQAGQQFALSHSWDRTYEALATVVASPAPSRAAYGGSIDAHARIIIKRRLRGIKGQEPIGVMKLGGLGDMLQATAVVTAAATAYGSPVIVFCNSHPEVFRALPCVVDVVSLHGAPQDSLVWTFADLFRVFLDLRYVSWAYGRDAHPPTEFALKHRWFYRDWIKSCARLTTLRMHSTRIMLESLGLDGSIDPIFTLRAESGIAVPGPYLAVASGVGTGGGLKAWPKQSWEELAWRCAPAHAERGLPFVQVGGTSDHQIPGAIDARGLDLPRTARVLERAQGLLAVEGGMVHLARAVGTRAAVIFGPTPVDAFAYSENIALSEMACHPCWWSEPWWGRGECALGVPSCVNFPSVTRVAAAVAELCG